MKRSAPSIVALVLLMVFAACGQPAPTPTPVPPPTVVPTAVLPTPTSPPQPTAGELAVLGQKVFGKYCNACHGVGFAPPPSLWVQRFANAQKLYDYARTRMPPSGPGSLKAEEYFQIVAWELVGYRIVAADAVLDVNKLSEVMLSK